MLIAQHLRWPLSTILLVLPDSNTVDNPAVHWTIQFARASQAQVSVLPLLSPSAGLQSKVVRHSVQALLQTKDPLGQKMRHIAQRFSEDEIKGSFKLREGKPQDQLRCELLVSDPDLVIIATEHQNSLWQGMSDAELILQLKSINCPILFSN